MWRPEARLFSTIKFAANLKSAEATKWDPINRWISQLHKFLERRLIHCMEWDQLDLVWNKCLKKAHTSGLGTRTYVPLHAWYVKKWMWISHSPLRSNHSLLTRNSLGVAAKDSRPAGKKPIREYMRAIRLAKTCQLGYIHFLFRVFSLRAVCI